MKTAVCFEPFWISWSIEVDHIHGQLDDVQCFIDKGMNVKFEVAQKACGEAAKMDTKMHEVAHRH